MGYGMDSIYDFWFDLECVCNIISAKFEVIHLLDTSNANELLGKKQYTNFEQFVREYTIGKKDEAVWTETNFEEISVKGMRALVVEGPNMRLHENL